MLGMRWSFVLTLLVFILASFSIAAAQSGSLDDQPHIQPKNMPPEPKEKAPPKPQPEGDSSSKDSEINLEGPSKTTSKGSAEVHELYPYNPHKAAKDIEVGQYYLKHKNYRAALDRFNEALLYKPNDAEATYRLAQTQEKLELYALADQNYRSYITIYKEGPYVKDAQEAIKRIEPHVPKTGAGGQSDELAKIINEGQEALAKNDFEDAHTSFVKALQMAPDDPAANFRVAQSLQGLQRLDEARIFYKKCLALQPEAKMASEAKRQIAQINFILGKEE